MTFRDYANHYLVAWFTRLHRAKPDLTWRECLAAFADAVTTAASDLCGKIAHDAGGLGLEVDVSSDYDPADGKLIADVHIRMVGTYSYIASAALLGHGFQYLVDDEAYHTTLVADIEKMRALR